jgi:hypothetical protein
MIDRPTNASRSIIEDFRRLNGSLPGLFVGEAAFPRRVFTVFQP